MSSSGSSRKRPDKGETVEYSPVKETHQGGDGAMAGLAETVRKPKVLLPLLLCLLVVIAVVAVVIYFTVASSSDSPSALKLGSCVEVTDGGGQQAAPAPEKVLASGHEDFTAKFYSLLSASNSGNFIASPLSLSSVLALASVGARGETASEIKAGVGLPCDEKILLDGYSTFMERLDKSSDRVQLDLANRIYLSEDFDVLDDYKDKGKRYFRAQPEKVDFGDDQTRLDINSWVERQTNDKIKDLFEPGSLTDAMRMVLVNAVYFRGDWTTKFDRLVTDNNKDFKGLQSTEKVSFMTMTNNFLVGELPESVGKGKMIKLPYGRKADRAGRDGDKKPLVSMYVVLPDEGTTLAELEANFGKLNMSDLDSMLPQHEQEVNLGLPKFKLETSHELNPILWDLGIQKMFRAATADFSGVTPTPYGLEVSDVIQKAFVKVDEEGAEAAAATGVLIRFTSYTPSVAFQCDRPFAFFIKEENSGITLFAGRFVQP